MEMSDNTYSNYEDLVTIRDPGKTTGTEPSGGESRRYKAAVLGLGLLSLLLLAGIIVCWTYNKEMVPGLAESLLNLTEERDQLKTSLLNLTEERDRSCPDGWSKFNRSCYFLSGEKQPWEDSRLDCRRRGAHLVIVESSDEQKFIYSFSGKKYPWIGLSDSEGSWKWVDGTVLTTAYWIPTQPDNGGGDPRYEQENCAHIEFGFSPKSNWNYFSCTANNTWICEKMACPT